MVRKFACAAGLIAALLSTTTFGAEGQFFGGPVGGTDIRNAYLPPVPGFYLGTVLGSGWGSQINGDNAKASPVQVHAGSMIGGVGLLYVYPFKILGGSLASAAQLSLVDGYMSLNHQHEYFRGIGDTYVELLSWSKYLGRFGSEDQSARPLPRLPYGLTVKLSYSMIFPTGKYNTTQIATPGHNVFFYIPNAAATYLTGPNFLGDGLEFSGHVFFDISSYNHRTNYQTGPLYDFDGAISERSGRWQYGVAGYYARQWGDDTQGGVPVLGTGKRLVTAAVGPVIAYDIPEWKASIKFKINFPVYERNTAVLTRVFMVFTKAL